MNPEHIPFVIEQHLKYFPDGFFARLGPGFLAAYSTSYLTSVHARGYIAEIHGEPVGFLVGVTDPAAHRRHVLRSHGRRLLLRGLGSLALRPRLTLHFLRTRLTRYCRRFMPNNWARQAPGNAGPPGITAVLAHVAVVEHARDNGIGADLIRRFVDDAYGAGCARVSLVTVAGDGGAGPYYARLGWLPRGETSTPDGRRLATYDFPLRNPQATEPY